MLDQFKQFIEGELAAHNQQKAKTYSDKGTEEDRWNNGYENGYVSALELVKIAIKNYLEPPLLEVGDEVYVNADIKPKLTWVIEYFQEYGNDRMACGQYGCFNIGLLKKVEPDQIEEMAHNVLALYLPDQTDSQLLGLSRAYQAMADTRRQEQPIQHLPSLFQNYPPQVFDLCKMWVDGEIQRRLSPVNITQGLWGLIDKSIDTGKEL